MEEKKIRMDDYVAEDRVNALPEAILHHIMSFLPFKQVSCQRHGARHGLLFLIWFLMKPCFLMTGTTIVEIRKDLVRYQLIGKEFLIDGAKRRCPFASSPFE